MIRAQEFKSFDGACKRARFENAHCNGRYHYSAVRFLNGQLDAAPFDASKFKAYTWRLQRETRK